jgi:TonB family protein
MKLYTTVLFLCFTQLCFAQHEPLLFAEEMPRFPGCEEESLALADKTSCSNQQLLAYVYQNIIYPDSAIVHNTEGSVVVRFVVKADGRIGEVNVVRDIGHGCGEEAKRVIEKMNADSIRWIPGKEKGVAKDVYTTLPVKFKLQPPPPDYVLIDLDTVYTKYHTAAEFPGGHEALLSRLQSAMKYPEVWKDSCYTGFIGCDLLVRGNGQVLVFESYNYANLPEEFIYDIIHQVSRTTDQWTIATHSNRPVSTLYPIRLRIQSPDNSCTQQGRLLEESIQLGEAGVKLFQEGQSAAALAKWDEAIARFPKSVEYRVWRGAAQVEENNFEAACPDLMMVKAVLGSSGYDDLLPLICR